MKREAFIFIFVMFVLLVSGAMFATTENGNYKIISLGCGTPSNPGNNNGGGSGGGNSGEGYKHPNDAQGLVKDISKPVDAKFVYESIRVINWKFIVDRTGLALNVPDVTILGQNVPRFAQAAFTLSKYPGSNEHCKYYSFSVPYTREAHAFQYNLNYKNIQTTGSTPHCVYDITPIQNDILAIASLGGDSLSGETVQVLAQMQQNSEATINLADFCAGFTDTSSPPNCAPTEQCSIDVALGDSAFYGVGYDIDSVGNIVILEDNAGLPILQANAGQSVSQTELSQIVKTRAENFISSCSKKYEQKSEQKCGNGKVEGDEECDDGNVISGDGCSSECKSENLLCDGIILPATSSQPIEGKTNVRINVDVKSPSILKVNYNFGAKTSVNMKASGLVDGEIPKTLKYVLTVEGNSAVAAAAYTESMLRTAKKNPNFWSLLNSVSGQGIVGLGTEYDLQIDGFTVSKVYIADTNLDEFANANRNIGQSNWMSFVTEVDLDYTKGSAGAARVRQTIYNDGEVKLSKDAVKSLSETDARKIILELLRNAESFDASEKSPANGQPLPSIPTLDGKDIYNQAKSGNFTVGTRISQKDDYRSIKTITYENDISTWLKYYNECIKKLEGESPVAMGNENANYAIYGNLA